MKAIREFLESNIDTKKITKILDVGFGRGEFTGILLEVLGETKEYVGIDVLEKSVEQANETFKEYPVEVFKMDASNMSFEDDSFDLVCISNTLHHIEDLSPVLKEMKRVCKQDGFILIQEMVSDNQTDKQMTHVTLHHFSAKLDTYFGRYHAETYSREELANLYDSFNLEVVASDEYLMHELYPIEDEQAVVKNIVGSMRKGIERIDNDDVRASLLSEFEEFADRLVETGFESATETLALLK